MVIGYFLIMLLLMVCGIASIVCYKNMSDTSRQVSLYNMVAGVIIIGLYSSYMFDKRVTDAELIQSKSKQIRSMDVAKAKLRGQLEVANQAKRRLSKDVDREKVRVTEAQGEVDSGLDVSSMKSATYDREIVMLKQRLIEQEGKYVKQIADYELALALRMKPKRVKSPLLKLNEYIYEDGKKRPMDDINRRTRWVVYASYPKWPDPKHVALKTATDGKGNIRLSCVPFGRATVFMSFVKAEKAMLHFMKYGPREATWSIRRYDISVVWIRSVGHEFKPIISKELLEKSKPVVKKRRYILAECLRCKGFGVVQGPRSSYSGKSRKQQCGNCKGTGKIKVLR